MSKSFDFCISAAQDKSRSNITDRDFSGAFELDMKDVCKSFEERGNIKFKVNNGNTSVHVFYDPDADFQYFTTSTSVNDGTLLFVLDNARTCLDKIFQLKTCYSPIGAPKNLNGAVLHYTVGNFVVVNEYGKQFATEEKPWMLERTTVMLPIKYGFKEMI